MTTNEKQAPSSTTKDLQHVYNKNDHWKTTNKT
jgi:hypothetical protein